MSANNVTASTLQLELSNHREQCKACDIFQPMRMCQLPRSNSNCPIAVGVVKHVAYVSQSRCTLYLCRPLPDGHSADLSCQPVRGHQSLALQNTSPWLNNIQYRPMHSLVAIKLARKYHGNVCSYYSQFQRSLLNNIRYRHMHRLVVTLQVIVNAHMTMSPRKIMLFSELYVSSLKTYRKGNVEPLVAL